MAETDWSPPPGLDTTKPTPARMYDYFLGGKDNFSADREAAKRVVELIPEVPALARENRAFLIRVVDYLARECGIDQFLDIGTGIPTSPNVHEVARSHIPGAHVVYVDNDPVVTAHNQALRATMDGVLGFEGDLRNPEEIFTHADLRSTIDLSRPVAVLCVAVVQFITPAEAATALRFIRDHVPSGSYLAITIMTGDYQTPDTVEGLLDIYRHSTAPAHLRGYDEALALFDGFDLVEPGLVLVTDWRPDIHTPSHGTRWLYAGLARKS